MLRSLNAGISGLRSHQTMLDTTGNNIANVNTTGFKGQSVQFQDTLSQVVRAGGAPTQNAGGQNPAQVGLGVQVAGIATNFNQGSNQQTGRATDMMIDGEGFFVMNKNGQQVLSRAGSFDFDGQGRLVSPDGGIVQGRMAVNGQVPAGGPLQDLVMPTGLTAGGQATTEAALRGNLPSEVAVGESRILEREVYNADGTSESLAITFTRTAGGWNAAASVGGATANAAVTINPDGSLGGADTINVGGIAVDLSDMTGYASLDNAAIGSQNGSEAGALESYSLMPDGTLMGRFSNGDTQALGQVILGQVDNPAGLEKVGNSGYVLTPNSGALNLGAPGSPGMGSTVSGAIEMSNVDLSEQFTNLIVAQRGFQANARIITTSDEVLQELTNLKR